MLCNNSLLLPFNNSVPETDTLLLLPFSLVLLQMWRQRSGT
jgi:hypothetical protein